MEALSTSFHLYSGLCAGKHKVTCVRSGWKFLEPGCERGKEKTVPGPKTGTMSPHWIVLSFYLPYILLPLPEPKHLLGIAARDQGLAQNTNSVSHNP